MSVSKKEKKVVSFLLYDEPFVELLSAECCGWKKISDAQWKNGEAYGREIP